MSGPAWPGLLRIDQRREDAAADRVVAEIVGGLVDGRVRIVDQAVAAQPSSSPRPGLYCLVRSTSRIRPGVENTSDGRCVASVLRMIMRSEGIAFHLAEEVQAVEALQVVEAVAVLQALHLRFEDEVEGRAEHAAERHDLFGKAADPQIDVVEAAERAAGVGAGGVEEVEPVGGRVDRFDAPPSATG